MNVSQYSIETDSWLKLHNIPKVLMFHPATSHDNSIFCGGGYQAVDEKTLQLQNEFFAYDTIGKVWSSKASMIHGRAKFSLEAVGAKIVACGGSSLQM